MIYNSRTNRFWPPKHDYQLRKRRRKSKTIQTSNRQISSLKLKWLFIIKNWGHFKQRSNYGISTFEMFSVYARVPRGFIGRKAKNTSFTKIKLQWIDKLKYDKDVKQPENVCYLHFLFRTCWNHDVRVCGIIFHKLSLWNSQNYYRFQNSTNWIPQSNFVENAIVL